MRMIKPTWASCNTKNNKNEAAIKTIRKLLPIEKYIVPWLMVTVHLLQLRASTYMCTFRAFLNACALLYIHDLTIKAFCFGFSIFFLSCLPTKIFIFSESKPLIQAKYNLFKIIILYLKTILIHIALNCDVLGIQSTYACSLHCSTM